MSIEEKIIKFVRDNNFLWDPKNVNYRNGSLREKKFIELAEQLNITVDQVKKKWHTLRVGFLRVHRKLAAKPIGSEGSVIKKWKYYDSLLFLRNPSAIPTKTMSPLENAGNHDYFGEGNDIITSENTQFEENAVNYCSTPSKTKSNLKKKRIDVHFLKQIDITRQHTQEDAEDYFGKMIAVYLRKYDDKTRQLLKIKIQQTILDTLSEIEQITT